MTGNLEELLKSLMARIDEQNKKIDERLAHMFSRLDSIEKGKSNSSSDGSSSSGARGSGSSKRSGSDEEDRDWGKKSIHFHHKVEFPVFDGSNARNWIKNCATYFCLCEIAEDEKVNLASMYMTGKAELWFESYRLFRTHIFWEDFMIDVRSQFKDESTMAEEIGEPSLSRTPNHIQEGHETSPNSITDTPKTWLKESQESLVPLVPPLSSRDGKTFKECENLQTAQNLFDEMPNRIQPTDFHQFVHDKPDEEIISLHTHPVEEISSMELIKMKKIDKTYLCSTVENVVFSAPTYINYSQHQAAQDGCVIVGLDVMCIINEPTLGVVTYGPYKQDTNNGEEVALIFDPGGVSGTLYVSLQQQKYVGPKGRCLRDANIDKSYVHKVFIVGNSTITIFDPGGVKGFYEWGVELLGIDIPYISTDMLQAIKEGRNLDPYLQLVIQQFQQGHSVPHSSWVQDQLRNKGKWVVGPDRGLRQKLQIGVGQGSYIELMSLIRCLISSFSSFEDKALFQGGRNVVGSLLVTGCYRLLGSISLYLVGLGK